jgi:starch-binding outer membrane protein, SusD/RagB family
MKKYIAAALTSTLVLAGACSDNPAAPSRDRIVAGQPQTLQALATGLIVQDRANFDGNYFLWGGIMARDAIVPTVNESRFVSEFYQLQPDPSDFIGGSQWNGYYTLLRAAQDLFKAGSYTSLSAGDQAATAGLVRNLQGQSYIRLIEYRNQNGVAIQGPDSSKVDPIKEKQSVLAYASALLDSGYASLQTASASVPFTVPPGYTIHGDYSQTANLKLWNRGLKGKVEVMRALDEANPNPGSAAVAIAALNSALADAPSPMTEEYLNTGPWYQYNQASPEATPNPLPGASNLVTDNFVSSFLPNDLRAKNILPSSTVKVHGFSGSNRLAATDPSNSALLNVPLPIMRNAELFLLRAQAEIATGDLAGATRDINYTHTVEGGLPPYPTFTTATDAINAVLYEIRYTFAYLGPQHIVALREYKLFNLNYVSQKGIPSPGATDALVSQLPITQNEKNARNGDITPVP